MLKTDGIVGFGETMNGRISSYLIDKLSSKHAVNKIDIGSDAVLKKGLLRFNVERYDVEDVGNLCVLSMTGFWGFVKMETVVLASVTKEVPLFNTDSISFGKQTVQIVELYDTRSAPGDGSLESACQAIKDEDADIEDYSDSTGNYSAKLLSCSYGKKSKTATARMTESAKKYVDLFAQEIESSSWRDIEAGRAKNAEFADSLLKNGGPAVNKIRKMFGEETAKRIIRNHMYGAD